MSIATDRRAQVSVQVGNQEISFETGHLAKQADGAVVVRSGETMVPHRSGLVSSTRSVPSWPSLSMAKVSLELKTVFSWFSKRPPW